MWHAFPYAPTVGVVTKTYIHMCAVFKEVFLPIVNNNTTCSLEQLFIECTLTYTLAFDEKEQGSVL